MSLAQRVLAGSLAIIVVLVVLIVILADRRLHARLVSETKQDLLQEAELVATLWRPGVNADSLANAVGRHLSRRVTLIDAAGNVIGDTEYGPATLPHLDNQSQRPEIESARQQGVGSSQQSSPSDGDQELFVAVRAPLGYARLSVSTRSLEDIAGGAERDVLTAAAIAALVALALTLFFARGVSRPIVELRDVAQSLAAGQLDRRPRLAAPGEIGDLAEALSRMAEQLSVRLNALQVNDVLTTALIDSLAEGVLALDSAGNVVRVNASARALLSIRDAVPFPSTILPRERALRDALSDAMRGSPTQPVEIVVGGRTLAVTARPLASGGAVITLFDLTPLRKLETVRRDFVANVSHELRTPLTAIQGFAETLADDELPVEQRRQFAATIRSNAQRMQRLVDDLLDLSRIESGGWQPQPQDIDVGSAIADATASLRGEAASRGLEIVEEISPDAKRMNADPTAIRQILSNLVENAIRYTPKGYVRIGSERLDGGVVLSVSDTGIGIPAEHLSRIFERFYRVDTSRSRAAGGTGLGLAIVKHLAEAHGGWVRAASAAARGSGGQGGTTLSVFFPDADRFAT